MLREPYEQPRSRYLPVLMQQVLCESYGYTDDPSWDDEPVSDNWL